MAIGCGADKPEALDSPSKPREHSARPIGSLPAPKGDPVQILHRLAGSIQRYAEERSDPDRYRPDHCPQYETHRPLRAHGFYTRTLVDIAFDGTIRSWRYL